MSDKKITAKDIAQKHKKSIEYKASLGKIGLFEQTKKNERFYVGDQWLGSSTKSNLPLIVLNEIKRIGEYKTSQILSNPLTVGFCPEGISQFMRSEDSVMYDNALESLKSGDNENFNNLDDDVKTTLVFSALTNYFESTTERLKLTMQCDEAIKDAFISGTGAIYTYWDENVNTGLFADSEKKTAVSGDIVTEVLDVTSQIDVENPAEKDINKQDYIIISKKVTVSEAKRIAKQNNIPESEIEKITADGDSDSNYSYERDENANDIKRVTVMTYLYKKYSKDNKDYSIHAVQATQKVILREDIELPINCYPLAIFRWIDRAKCFYGDSEVTYLIPNQISINKMTTSSVWSAMYNGTPILMINRNAVKGKITNQPGQIWEFNGNDDIRNAAYYLQPPPTSSALSNNADNIIHNTLQHSGANDAALGNMNPDNATAIVALQEAANAPMQMFKNRYYQFYEDIARIFVSFWIANYGKRKLKISDKKGSWYLPFNGDDYKKIAISIKIDVGASTVWSQTYSRQMLDSMLTNGFITFKQYLERLPSGSLTDVTGLIKDIEAKEMQAQQQDESIDNLSADDFYGQLSPEEREAFDSMDHIQQQELINNAKLAVKEEQGNENQMY